MKSESVQVEIRTLSFCSFDAGVRVVIASGVCEAIPKPRFGDSLLRPSTALRVAQHRIVRVRFAPLTMLLAMTAAI
jgi:hypothetical protein